MALTRKEKLLKAMLEDNSAGCGCGVTREERMLANVARKTCDNDALESIPTKVVSIIDGTAIMPGMLQYNGTDKIEDIVWWLRNHVNYNVEFSRMVMADASGTNMTVRKSTGSKYLKNDDGTYNAIVYFGDDLAPIILDSVNNTITLDPDWVAPTEGGGNIVITYDGTNYTCNVPYEEFGAALNAGSHITFIADNDSGITIMYYQMVKVQYAPDENNFVIEVYDGQSSEAAFMMMYTSSGISKFKYV